MHLNGSRTKPAREVRPVTSSPHGRRNLDRRGQALSDRRGPAHVARLLYEETPESLAAREWHGEARRFVADPPPTGTAARPSATGGCSSRYGES